ncbi:(2,3-dihydroxybenzoyl)adenylate synthase [Micromonospora craniellae]|uniref:(2,3-dihydroxybenzoyl)adenylate synthase n=1 Tax=Micromonospora craniellae TaxID=2294034 RepID=A0A372G605_9ACTN|nr:(2,3-dihydroxybenzoyl)adenylate synthase [Micromonospora craniellae]QOC90146.1 (2,3-dihydroxybenzoyl)adenylate synthase [Micromonospora craniellae]RFS48467.1 (2,3-dihydroxybenzoyl)adenylate synthase [Micromonospora craniellae]
MNITPWPSELAERYRAAGYWRGQSFSAALREWASRHGPRTAVVDGNLRRSYQDLDVRASRFASGFAVRGIRPGDRVVVQLPNTADFFDIVFGLLRLGAVPVFALPAHRESELGYFCRHSEAVAIVLPGTHDGFDHRTLIPAVRAAAPTVRHTFQVGEDLGVPPEPLPDPDPGALAFLQLSGGSTGLPKLIPRTADDYLYSVRESAEICGLSTATVYLCVLPVAHNFTLSSPGVLGVLHAGGTVVMCPRPNPDTAFPLIERERVTITALVPPLALIWLTAAETGGYDLSSLQVLQVGGAKLTADVARRIGPTLGAAVQQVFGMAEGLVNYTRLDDPAELVEQTQGRPISPADEILIVDDEDVPVTPGATGHLLTRGPYTIRGYFRADEHNAVAFTSDGFYRTGDLVRQTPEGYLVVTGRAKDQINRGGEKIAAEEIENHLLAHPAVHDAAVVAVADPYLGERTCAFVTLRAGVEGPTANQLRSFIRSRGLAAYKVPDRVRIVPAFPVTGVGKISRTDLRAALRAHLAQEG